MSDSPVSTARVSPDSPRVTPDHAGRRASRLLWIVGGVEAVFFLGGSTVVGRAAAMSVEQLYESVGRWFSYEQVAAVHPQLWTLYAVLLGVGFVPGVAFVLLGHGVRRQRPLCILLAAILASLQLAAMGVLLVRQIVYCVATANPPALTVNVLAIGTPMALLVFMIRCLVQSRRGRRVDG